MCYKLNISADIGFGATFMSNLEKVQVFKGHKNIRNRNHPSGPLVRSLGTQELDNVRLGFSENVLHVYLYSNHIGILCVH